MACGPRLSSRRSETTTRASSSAVIVRGGALATSRSRLCSLARPGRSMTAGTSVKPASRQRSKRRNPSTTSKKSSGAGTTRIGRSASSGR